ncbi:hypothetical protein D3C75_895240 [compost metagenome]
MHTGRALRDAAGPAGGAARLPVDRRGTQGWPRGRALCDFLQHGTMAAPRNRAFQPVRAAGDAGDVKLGYRLSPHVYLGTAPVATGRPGNRRVQYSPGPYQRGGPSQGHGADPPPDGAPETGFTGNSADSCGGFERGAGSSGYIRAGAGRVPERLCYIADWSCGEQTRPDLP